MYLSCALYPRGTYFSPNLFGSVPWAQRVPLYQLAGLASETSTIRMGSSMPEGRVRFQLKLVSELIGSSLRGKINAPLFCHMHRSAPNHSLLSHFFVRHSVTIMNAILWVPLTTYGTYTNSHCSKYAGRMEDPLKKTRVKNRLRVAR